MEGKSIMKKITFLADASNAHMERWLSSLQSDFEIQIITQTKNENLDPRIHQVVYKLNPARFFPIRPLKMIWQIYRIKKQIRAFMPDLIHVHYAIAHPIYYVLPEGVPLITSLWGSDIVPLPNKAFDEKIFSYLRKYFARSVKITVPSPYLAGFFEKLFHDTYAKPEIIPFGIDTNLFVPKPQPSSRPVVVGFARAFLRHYGFLDLLFACEPLLKAGLIKLKVAGDGPEKNLYRYEVERLKLKDSVEFVGRISPVFKMPEFYQSIDIFAAPSHRESFGVAALEASSCGIPVVAARVGGLRDTIINEQTGLTFLPGELDKLREAIERLAKDEKLRKTLGENGRKKVQAEFEWKDNVAQMKQLYASITQK